MTIDTKKLRADLKKYVAGVKKEGSSRAFVYVTDADNDIDELYISKKLVSSKKYGDKASLNKLLKDYRTDKGDKSDPLSAKAAFIAGKVTLTISEGQGTLVFVPKIKKGGTAEDLKKALKARKPLLAPHRYIVGDDVEQGSSSADAVAEAGKLAGQLEQDYQQLTNALPRLTRMSLEELQQLSELARHYEASEGSEDVSAIRKALRRQRRALQALSTEYEALLQQRPQIGQLDMDALTTLRNRARKYSADGGQGDLSAFNEAIRQRREALQRLAEDLKQIRTEAANIPQLGLEALVELRRRLKAYKKAGGTEDVSAIGSQLTQRRDFLLNGEENRDDTDKSDTLSEQDSEQEKAPEVDQQVIDEIWRLVVQGREDFAPLSEEITRLQSYAVNESVLKSIENHERRLLAMKKALEEQRSQLTG